MPNPNDPTRERGGGDHDQPFEFGRRPSWLAPAPFTPWAFSHLLEMRGRRQDGRYDDDIGSREEWRPDRREDA